jgi:hypothetical protein
MHVHLKSSHVCEGASGPSSQSLVLGELSLVATLPKKSQQVLMRSSFTLG